MLLRDYCFEINTRGIKKKGKKLSNTNYWLNRSGPALLDWSYEQVIKLINVPPPTQNNSQGSTSKGKQGTKLITSRMETTVSQLDI